MRVGWLAHAVFSSKLFLNKTLPKAINCLIISYCKKCLQFSHFPDKFEFLVNHGPPAAP